MVGRKIGSSLCNKQKFNTQSKLNLYYYREGTQEFLERMSLTDLVDLVVCGDDPESISKPDPHNARYSLYATSSRAMCACI